MKSDRLLATLLLLRTHGRMSAPELAARLEVSVRTVYRDVTALSAAGVPVYAERGRHGGIALLPHYRTDVTGLTRSESRALFVMAARGVHADLGLDDALSSALRKVMAALPEPHRPDATRISQRILVDPVGWWREAAQPPALGTLQQLVFDDIRVTLRYRHGDDPAVHRYTVDPYGLVSKSGTWYLVADHRGRARLYRVSRILGVAATEDPVRRRPHVDLAGAWESLRRAVEDRPTELMVTAMVRASAFGLVSRVMGRSLTGAPEMPRAGGWAEVQLRFRHPKEARRLLVFGTDVVVTGPPEVRDDLAATAAATADSYRATGTGARGGPVASGGFAGAGRGLMEPVDRPVGPFLAHPGEA